MGQNQNITLWPSVDTFVSWSPYGPPVTPSGEQPGSFPYAPGQVEIGVGTGAGPLGPGIAVPDPRSYPGSTTMSDILGTPNSTRYVAAPSSRSTTTLRFVGLHVGGFNYANQLTISPPGIPTNVTDARQIRFFQVFAKFGYVGHPSIPPDSNMVTGTWAPAGIKFRMDGPNLPGTPYPLEMPWDVVSTGQVADVTATPPNLSTAGYYGGTKNAWLTPTQQIQEILNLTGKYFTATAPVTNVIPTATISIQYSDISSINLGFEVASYAGSTPEIDLKQLGLIVYYNDAPTVQVTIGDEFDGSFVNTDTPTVGWTYFDTEFDPQKRFIVAVVPSSYLTHPLWPAQWGYNSPELWTIKTVEYSLFIFAVGERNYIDLGADVNEGIGYPALVPPDFPNGNLTHFPLIGYSKPVASTATSWQIPPGKLRNGVESVAYVLTSDDGSNGRYNAVLGASTTPGINEGIIFTPIVEPFLMPEITMPESNGVNALTAPTSTFDPVAGSIGPINVRERLNLLARQDSDFTGGYGGWVPYPGHGWNGGSPTIASSGFVNYVSFDSTVAFGAQSGPATVNPGDILTASTWFTNGSTGSTFRIGVQFYTDAAGTVSSSFAAPPVDFSPFNGMSPNPVVWSTQVHQQTGGFTKAFVQTRVPLGAVTARLIVWSDPGSGGTPLQLANCGLTCNTLNLLDDPSFDNSFSPTTPIFWSGTTAGTSTIAFTYPDTTTPDTTPPSYSSKYQAVLTPDGIASTCRLDTTTKWNLYDPNGVSVYLAQYDYRSPQSGSTPFNGLSIPSTASTTLPTPVPTTVYSTVQGQFLTGSDVGSSVISVTNTIASTPVDVDNLLLEQVWPFQPIDTTIADITLVPNFAPLGNVCASGSTWGQGWTTSSLGAAVYATHTDLSLLLYVPGYVDQLFSVSGYGELNFSFYWGGGTAEATIEFFTSGGTRLSQSALAPDESPVYVNVLATRTSAAAPDPLVDQVTGSVYYIPPNAAYARLAFTLTIDTGVNLYVNQITCTPAVLTTLVPSRPWMDGGWSAGGFQTSSAPGVGLQRSSDLQNWYSVRIQPNNAVNYNPAPLSASYTLPFTDYEYPSSDYGVGETVYYRGVGLYPQLTDVVQTPYSQVLSLTSVDLSLAPTQWLLIDPRYPASNISLSVRKASFSQDENQTVFMPVGRGRKVVVGDTQIFGDTITLDLLTVSNADFRSLQTQYQKVYPLLLRSPDGEMWYVRLTKRSRERVWQGHYTLPYRTYSITMEQVDATP